MVYGFRLWSMDYGETTPVDSPEKELPVVHGLLWLRVYGLWSMVYGLWSMVYGPWLVVVYGP